MARRIEVKAGQNYRESGIGFLGSRRRLWTVAQVLKSIDGQAHAVIESADGDRTRKTISTHVLLDRSRYMLEETPAGLAAAA
jgi:hypothetical protein